MEREIKHRVLDALLWDVNSMLRAFEVILLPNPGVLGL